MSRRSRADHAFRILVRGLQMMRAGVVASLAFAAMETGDSAPAVLNAANEVAVEQFLEGRIGFSRIPELVEEVLNRVPVTPLASLDDVMSQDRLARARADEYARTLYD